MPAAFSRFSSALHQSVMRWLRALLRGAIARDEFVGVGRAVLLVVRFSDGSVAIGSRSSVTEASSQLVSTSGRPAWALSEM